MSAAASAEADRRADDARAGPRLRGRAGESLGELLDLGTAGNSCEAILIVVNAVT